MTTPTLKCLKVGCYWEGIQEEAISLSQEDTEIIKQSLYIEKVFLGKTGYDYMRDLSGSFICPNCNSPLLDLSKLEKLDKSNPTLQLLLQKLKLKSL